MRNLFWFRRDLRIEDNVALYHSLKDGNEVIPLFVIEPEFINSIDTGSAKVHFLFDSIKKLGEYFQKINSKLIIRFGEPVSEINKIVKEANVKAIYFNRCYESNEIIRDEKVIHTMNKLGIQVKIFKDQVIFEEDDLDVNTNFYDYKEKWNKKLKPNYYKPVEVSNIELAKFIDYDWGLLSLGAPNPQDYNFKLQTKYKIAGEEQAKKILNKVFKEKSFNYENNYLDFYSFISPYIRFGNISVRQLISKIKPIYRFLKKAEKLNLSEVMEYIIKKEYYSQLSLNKALAPAMNSLESSSELNSDYKNFFIWCNGETGFPIIDAAMKQLNQEGLIHTELKHLTAEFLVNLLMIDEKWGERYFMHKLISSEYHLEVSEWENIKINDINLIERSKSFDKKGDFIRKYIPSLKDIPVKYIHEPYKLPANLQKKIKFIIGVDYPFPIVELNDNIEKIDIVINELEEK